MGLRVGIFDHLGWAVAVTASPGHDVVDRRRIELLGPGLPNAPVHDPGRGLSVTDVEVLHGPRERLGPPWTKDHRTALAATILAPVGAPSLSRRWPRRLVGRRLRLHARLRSRRSHRWP